MNLPSLTRAAFATGFISALLVLPAAAKTPPYLGISSTSYVLSPVRSPGATNSNGHVFVAGGFSTTGSTVTNLVQNFDLAKRTRYHGGAFAHCTRRPWVSRILFELGK